jgi:hypothetical protein
MPSQQPATTIRLTDADRKIIAKLRKQTGLDSTTSVIKMAIRESLGMRQSPTPGDALLAKLQQMADNLAANERTMAARGLAPDGSRIKPSRAKAK